MRKSEKKRLCSLPYSPSAPDRPSPFPFPPKLPPPHLVVLHVLVAETRHVEDVEAQAVADLDLAVEVVEVGLVLAVDLGQIAVVVLVEKLESKKKERVEKRPRRCSSPEKKEKKTEITWGGTLYCELPSCSTIQGLAHSSRATDVRAWGPCPQSFCGKR